MHDAAWIDDEATLLREVAALPAGDIALDTEADSFHHYRDKVCLVQITAGPATLLVDPLAGVSLEPLRGILANRSRRKILHGADYDIRILHRDFQLEVGSIFDTMIAARLTGETSVGLAALLERHLGVVLDKAHQRADWSRRPLTPAMLAYAAADTRHLEALAAVLEERLRALGRIDWAHEEFERLEALRWKAAPLDGESWRRVKGAPALDRRGLAVLRVLWSWRDGEAQRRDRPPFMVARDEVLVAIARGRPATPEELRSIDGVHPGLLRPAAANALLDAVIAGQGIPEAELPEPFETRRPRPDPAFEARVTGMKKARDTVAKELELDPAVLASRSTLEAIQRAKDAGDDPESIPELRAWQRGVLRKIF